MDRHARQAYERGWEYFERYVLPRYIVDEGDVTHKAESGEREKHTRLYSFHSSSINMFKEVSGKKWQM